MFTVGSSTSATFVLPVRHGTGVALQRKRMDASQNPQSTAGALARGCSTAFADYAPAGFDVAFCDPKKGCEARGCRYVMWMIMTKLQDVQQEETDWTFPTKVFFYPSGGTKFMLLGSVTKHPSRSTAAHISKSISCGRCGTVNYHPLLNL